MLQLDGATVRGLQPNEQFLRGFTGVLLARTTYRDVLDPPMPWTMRSPTITWKCRRTSAGGQCSERAPSWELEVGSWELEGWELGVDMALAYVSSIVLEN